MKVINQEKHLNYDIIEYDVVDSTMNVVKNFPKNTIIVAKKQESGRGKGNRTWTTNDNNNNLYFSIILKADKSRLDYSQLSFITSVAVREAIEKFDKKNNLIVSKWPNDILINNKKCCGILLEFDHLNKNLVIGCGINIDYFPESAMFKATSLKNEEIFTNKYNILKEFLNNFNILIGEWENQGFSIIRQKWLKSCYKLNEEIEVNAQKGIFQDIDEDGTLIIKLNNNENLEVKSGDVF